VKPIIAITGRRISARELAKVDERWAETEADMFWSDFGKKVTEAGGLPVLLPYEAADPAIVARVDGLILTGGQDVDPRVWGGPPPTDAGDGVLVIDRRRDDYEISLVLEAIDRGVPVLGVCRGHQVLNVALGGTLVPDLPDRGIRHVSPAFFPDTRPDKEHRVAFRAASLAAELYGPTAAVNSWHHQAVDRLGRGLVASAHADDGVVEAIELPGHPVLGLQWHPEGSVELEPCFSWLVEQAQSVASQHHPHPQASNERTASHV
jgi:putative glutamine amidotransferase